MVICNVLVYQIDSCRRHLATMCLDVITGTWQDVFPGLEWERPAQVLSRRILLWCYVGARFEGSRDG